MFEAWKRSPSEHNVDARAAVVLLLISAAVVAQPALLLAQTQPEARNPASSS
jgi:hypothetical protein